MFNFSQSNDGLVRVTPLAVWAAEIDDIEMHKKIILAESSFTHSNRLAQDANFVYCQAIAYLLKHSSDVDKVEKAFCHALDLCGTHATAVYEGNSI